MIPLQRFLSEEDGVDAIEYGIIAALIFLAIIVAVSAVASNSVGLWSEISTHVASASSP